MIPPSRISLISILGSKPNHSSMFSRTRALAAGSATIILIFTIQMAPTFPAHPRIQTLPESTPLNSPLISGGVCTRLISNKYSAPAGKPNHRSAGGYHQHHKDGLNSQRLQNPMNVTFFGKWLLQFDPAQDGQFVGFNVGMLPVIDGLSAVMTDNDASKLVFIVYMVEGDRSRIILQSDQTLAFLSILPTAPGSYHVLGSIIPTPATALQPEGADVLTINETSHLQEGTYIQLQYLDWTMVWQGNFGPNTIQLLLVPPNPRFPPLPVPALRMTYRPPSLATT